MDCKKTGKTKSGFLEEIQILREEGVLMFSKNKEKGEL